MRLEGCEEAFDMHEEDNDDPHKDIEARAIYESARVELYQLSDFNRLVKVDDGRMTFLTCSARKLRILEHTLQDSL